MNVVFRVDASVRIGTGHLFRCMTLAESLRERGAQIRFISREHTGNLISLLHQRDLQVITLPGQAINDPAMLEAYSSWLGATQSEDAEQTIKALNDFKPDWLVVDHYGIDAEWEQEIRPHVGRLMVIDDLFNRRHDCDVLLNQNYYPDGKRRYSGLVREDTCRLLVGQRYALLRPEYASFRKNLRIRDGKVKRVLVFFGGTDPQNMTGMALDALSLDGLKHLEVDVVIGSNNPNRNLIERQVANRDRTTLYEPRPNLADLMAWADLAIGAGGTTTWERMCLGLPAVIVTIAENQRPFAEALSEKKLAFYAGHSSEVSTENLFKFVLGLISDSSLLAEVSAQNNVMVDGLGAERVREAMLPTTDISQIQLRTARQDDVYIYFNWANDPEVRKSSFKTDPISWSTHKEWFAQKLSDPKSHLFVLEANGLAVGQIRFDSDGNDARIDFSLDPLVRGRGWGARLVLLGTGLMRKIGLYRYVAEVKPSNDASREVFLRLGFTLSESKNGCLMYSGDPKGIRELV